jgi:hypothetical protein
LFAPHEEITVNWTFGRITTIALSSAIALLLAGCLGTESAPANAPSGFTVAPGENAVTLSWATEAGHEYWLNYKLGTTITMYESGNTTIMNASSPRILTGLTNDTAYAFILTSSQNGSPVGPATATLTATPRIAGNTWTNNAALGSKALRNVATGTNGTVATLVAVGDGGTLFSGPFSYATAGAATWTAVASSPTTQDLTAAIYAASQFIAVGAVGTVITSTDASTWTLKNNVALTGTPVDLNGIAYISRYVAVGKGGVIMTSSDLVTWTPATSGTNQDLLGVAVLNSKFFAYGSNGALLESTDGLTWTTLASNTTSALRGAYYGSSTYVVVGDNGAVLTSSDGTTWTARASGTTSNLNAVSYGTRFIAVGNSGTIIQSADSGVTWTATTGASTENLYGMLTALAPTLYLAVGANGSNQVAK